MRGAKALHAKQEDPVATRRRYYSRVYSQVSRGQVQHRSTKKKMCPPNQTPSGVQDNADQEAVAQDGLAQFAIGMVEQQAAERGEEVTEVDMSFVQRALAESTRMRRETQNSDAKRAALWEGISSSQGPAAVDTLQQAMSEHREEAAAFLAQQQQHEAH